MPNPRGLPGHLYAELKIMVPPSLNKEERTLYQKLASISDFNPREEK
jgi:curved DNA-binding protein